MKAELVDGYWEIDGRVICLDTQTAETASQTAAQYRDFAEAWGAVADAILDQREAEKRAAEDAKVERLARAYWAAAYPDDQYRQLGAFTLAGIRAVLAALESEQ